MVQVKVTEGILDGEKVSSEICGTYYSFKGIPYAAPPVGNLRFKAPQPPIPWTGIRSAKELGGICYQFNFLKRVREKGSEDCLYLNIYTPNINPTKLMPVMIWIHGGAFCCGSGDDDLYGPEFLIRNGIVLVTINYRLEILGFLCLDTEDIPGNAGIKDQVAAMRWVKKNILNFGGDPENITIFGQSSGAACVTYHCVSPMTKGLFKRAIAQSGCMMNPWAQSYRPRERAIALARHLGCTSQDDKELYEFFKSQPVENLAEIQVCLMMREKDPDKYETQFTVVSEKKFPDLEVFFTGDIIEALKTDIHDGVELLLGYNEDEGTVNVIAVLDVDKMVHHANSFIEYLVPRPFSLYCSVHDQIDIGRTVKEHYLQNRRVTTKHLDAISKNPTPDIGLGITWRQFKAETQNYMEIGQTLTRRTMPDRDEQLFWGELFKKYLPQMLLPGDRE
ncbi:juvenile hormone esterase-like [Ostrinia nubilalis]|uniref:juvenile hormone esterase-like n=1 Tax=Ostrinia nubilalis TaxID=29057 RepID=UPI0030822570